MARKFGRNVAFSLATMLLSVAAACGGDKSTGPDMGDVAGPYEATVLTATKGGVQYDAIADGASIHLVLAEDGTTSGSFFVPASDLNDNVPVSEGMAGTWTLDGGTVHISQPADTFIRDLPLAVDGDKLTGNATFDDVQVHLVLSRQD